MEAIQRDMHWATSWKVVTRWDREDIFAGGLTWVKQTVYVDELNLYMRSMGGFNTPWENMGRTEVYTVAFFRNTGFRFVKVCVDGVVEWQVYNRHRRVFSDLTSREVSSLLRYTSRRIRRLIRRAAAAHQ